MYELCIGEQPLDLDNIRRVIQEPVSLSLSEQAVVRIKQSQQTVADNLTAGNTMYGINTGFGRLASVKINDDEIQTLQTNLILSHACGVGELLSDDIVRLIVVLKIHSLAQGFSGIRLEAIKALIQLINAEVYPCIPSQGSVGASGDLAPLAHMSLSLIGVGEVRYQGDIISAEEGLKKAKLTKLHLVAKEGLALLNGTQASTSIALSALVKTFDVFETAIIAGALSVDAARGSDSPFDARIHKVRVHEGQQQVATCYADLLKDSEIRASHRDCERVQDPYSLRCQPQVMGACLEQIQFAQKQLINEANAVTDNPLIFSDDDDILSGGNFHAQTVAFAADNLALAIAEMGALSERRTALLIDKEISGLPAFLTPNSGVNSGFMIAQVTAAALASENKTYAHPASIDSIPTSANQEDHVSMATFAANRLHNMLDNTARVIAIELLAACQGIHLLHPQQTSKKLKIAFNKIRNSGPDFDKDAFFAPAIETVFQFVINGELSRLVDIRI